MSRLKTIKTKLSSLKVSMFVTLAVGIILALFTYFACQVVMGAVIENYYLSEEERAERIDYFVKDLQSYVTRNKLTGSDNKGFAEWAENNRYLYLMVYKDDQLLFDSGAYDEPPAASGTDVGGGDTADTPDSEEDSSLGSGITVRFPTREELIKYAEENDVHLISTADEKVLMVSMADFTEYLYYDINNIVSIVAAVAVLFVVMMLHFHGVTSRITKLASDVSRVAEGDTGYKVDLPGDDEIATLSKNVDAMRSSILENIDKERAAMNANAELITAMSHDIRTPLTVLLGYLDMMRSQEVDRAAMAEYVGAAEKTALRLKKLSDDLFSYFLLFGSGAAEPHFDKYDARVLISQMLSEYTLLLREKGYNVETLESFTSEGASIKTDPDMLMRMFENIFSNIFKYADKSYPVSILASESDAKIQLKFTNNIAIGGDLSETSGIGLRTCYKIAEALGIDFSAGSLGEMYSVDIEFVIDYEVE